MKRSSVVVQWKEGFHLRAAARVVQSAQRYRSTVVVKFQNRVANARSILAVMTLCAAMGSVLEIEAAGDDESDALAAVEAAFAPDVGSGKSADSRHA